MARKKATQKAVGVGAGLAAAGVLLAMAWPRGTGWPAPPVPGPTPPAPGPTPPTPAPPGGYAVGDLIQFTSNPPFYSGPAQWVGIIFQVAEVQRFMYLLWVYAGNQWFPNGTPVQIEQAWVNGHSNKVGQVGTTLTVEFTL